MKCPDCGNSLDECSDPDRLWYPFRRVCYASMERSGASEAYASLHEAEPFHNGRFSSWSKTQSTDHPYRYDAAVTIDVADRDLAPWDEFLTERDASPIRSVAEQAPGEQDETDGAK